jgi:S-adenosylmethionine decarboxylase
LVLIRRRPAAACARGSDVHPFGPYYSIGSGLPGPDAWQPRPAVRQFFKSARLGDLQVVKPLPRLKLQGFNNLTKALSFNIYDVCYAVSEEQRRRYIEYIDEAYNADRLTQILTEVAEIIGANVLNVARQDYDPQGASVTILISEEPVIDKKAAGKEVLSGAVREHKDAPDPADASVVAHLDKSHITVHTYPETHPHNGIATFRADIDVATCGVISPLKALNYLIESLESDIVIMDYRVRGFTRDVKGTKHYIDHRINSIQDYLAKGIKNRYEMFDVNVYQENIFHTKMHVKDFDLDTYLFEEKAKNLSFKERLRIEAQLKREIEELFHGRNLD